MITKLVTVETKWTARTEIGSIETKEQIWIFKIINVNSEKRNQTEIEKTSMSFKVFKCCAKIEIETQIENL